MGYRLQTPYFFLHEGLKRDNKKEDYERKSCKKTRRINKFSLRCRRVFITLEKQRSIFSGKHELQQ